MNIWLVATNVLSLACLVPTAIAQSCVPIVPCALPPVPCAPEGAQRVYADYSVGDGNGPYYVVDNWIDSINPGRLDMDTVPPSGISDTFTFTAQVGAMDQTPIQLADAVIMYLESQHGNWWYVTGTTGAITLGFTNFEIFRTQDFKHFELHMFAFNRTQNCAHPSGQWQEVVVVPNPTPQNPNQTVTVRRQHIGTDVYHDFWGGPLFYSPHTRDANLTDNIHLIGSAFQNDPNPITDISLNPPIPRIRSMYRFSISKQDFLSWHCRNPLADAENGPRFADARCGPMVSPMMGYRVDNGSTDPTVYFDGGYRQGQAHGAPPNTGIPIPCSATNRPSMGLNCGPSFGNSMIGPTCDQVTLAGFAGTKFNCSGGILGDSVIEQGMSIFFDPLRNPGDPWSANVLYNWCWVPNVGTPNYYDRTYGCHVGLAAFMPDSLLQGQQPVFDAVAGVRQLAYGRNRSNGTSFLATPRLAAGCAAPILVDNGAVGAPEVACLKELANGAWVEGQSAFYCYTTGHYYMLYTRNVWTTPAYEIVYRKMPAVEAGSPRRFSDMALAQFGESNLDISEKVLLACGRLDESPLDPLARNYGSPYVFAVRTTPDCTCTTPDAHFKYYLAFFAKADGQGRRTVFFKELTFDAAGDIMQLTDDVLPGDPNY